MLCPSLPPVRELASVLVPTCVPVPTRSRSHMPALVPCRASLGRMRRPASRTRPTIPPSHQSHQSFNSLLRYHPWPHAVVSQRLSQFQWHRYGLRRNHRTAGHRPAIAARRRSADRQARKFDLRNRRVGRRVDVIHAVYSKKIRGPVCCSVHGAARFGQHRRVSGSSGDSPSATPPPASRAFRLERTGAHSRATLRADGAHKSPIFVRRLLRLPSCHANGYGHGLMEYGDSACAAVCAPGCMRDNA